MDREIKPVHIVTDRDNIAEIVLLPGDPLRAKYIAEHFLTDAKLVNDVRNMLAYTGFYKDKRITVMGSGMGIASVAIYAYELYHFYGVEKIIRIGTSGSLSPNVHPLDVVLSTGAYSNSHFAHTLLKHDEPFVESSASLNQIISDTAREKAMTLKCGPTYTSEVFDVYVSIEDEINSCPLKDQLLAVEMEGFGLLHIAKYEKKEAALLMTVSDSKYEPGIEIPVKDRETNLNDMITLALDSIIK